VSVAFSVKYFRERRGVETLLGLEGGVPPREHAGEDIALGHRRNRLQNGESGKRECDGLLHLQLLDPKSPTGAREALHELSRIVIFHQAHR
jgi:hypothetical protein